MKQLGYKKHFFYPFTLITILVAASFLALFGYTAIAGNSDLIKSDGVAYYSYLPTIFIHQSLDHRYVLADLQNTTPENVTSALGMNYNANSGQFVNKYPIGTALLETPFFFAGHFAALLLGQPITGFSWPYQIAIYASALFYMCIAVYFLWPVLRQWFSKRISFLAILSLLLGTNLIHYFTYDAAFSHVYSFFLFSLLINLVWLKRDQKPKYFWLLGLIMGLIVLVRPTNIIIGLVLLPLLRNLKLKQFFQIALAGFLTVSLQLVIWKLTTGQWLTFSYPGEYFDFTQPQVADVLFSVKKGLLFWSPVLVLSIVGLVPLYLKKSKKIPLLILTILLLQLFIVSSWWAWSYGYSFGHRGFTEYLVLLAIPLAAAIEFAARRSITKYLVLMLITLLGLINLNNMQLYWRGYIYPDGETWPHYQTLILNPCILKANNCTNIYNQEQK